MYMAQKNKHSQENPAAGWVKRLNELHCLISSPLCGSQSAQCTRLTPACLQDKQHTSSSYGDSWLQAQPLWLHHHPQNVRWLTPGYLLETGVFQVIESITILQQSEMKTRRKASAIWAA